MKDVQICCNHSSCVCKSNLWKAIVLDMLMLLLFVLFYITYMKLLSAQENGRLANCAGRKLYGIFESMRERDRNQILTLYTYTFRHPHTTKQTWCHFWIKSTKWFIDPVHFNIPVVIFVVICYVVLSSVLPLTGAPAVGDFSGGWWVLCRPRYRRTWKE